MSIITLLCSVLNTLKHMHVLGSEANQMDMVISNLQQAVVTLQNMKKEDQAHENRDEHREDVPHHDDQHVDQGSEQASD